ncbi:MAG: glycosyltransferase family 4 protein [Bacteroidota bacterium]|nr:glycosyltransferase family 4 protein [Bacteroidota bacterium]
MKIAFIATYPPRECGIGTFTNNLYKSMLNTEESQKDGHTGFVVAISDHDLYYEYTEEVKLIIRQDHQKDYLEAVEYINLSGADVCILEHEFGIFGGRDGSYILPLLQRLKIPLIVTLHTILKSPSYSQKYIMQEICRVADKVVVMTNKAIELLIDIYKISKSKIRLAEHGVPDIHLDPQECRKAFKFENRKVLLTFGFVGRNKGIETVINALANVVEKYPETLYIILGKTHPNILIESGEEYRVYLMRLVSNLHLEKNVVFLNKFLDEPDLFKYLYACDIYITPYLNEAQITSGTLSYAVGIGGAVLSTPYWHAAELLSEGRGELFGFGDSEGLSVLLMELFDNPEKLATIKQHAYDYGLGITWPKTGSKYLKIAEEALTKEPKIVEKTDIDFNLLILPTFTLSYVNRLTDDTGIIQHAEFGIPDRIKGYCLDDNARALLMALMDYRQIKKNRTLELISIYLSYIHYMQNPDGTFRNFMSYNRNYLDEIGSEDSFGRTIWALGFLLGNAPNYAYYQAAKKMLFSAAPNFDKLESIRGIANTIIGICLYLKSNPSDANMVEKLKHLSSILLTHYKENKSPDWLWFEPILAYDNGILPLALLHTAGILNDEKVREAAIESMNFLTNLTFLDHHLSIIGNEHWYEKGGERSFFSQQPIDVMSMVLMFDEAFHLTKDKSYLNKLYTSFLWFLGENDLKVTLYDFETKGCYDGFDQNGVNRNQGAESTLAYLISYLAVLRAYEEHHSTD